MAKAPKISTHALGAAIKMARENARMSATDVAQQTEITTSSLSRTENGHRAVELAEALQLVDVIGISLDDLIKTARHLDSQGVLQQKIAAKNAFDQSLAEVRAAAAEIMKAI